MYGNKVNNCSKLNLGSGPQWSKEGWVTLDHDVVSFPLRLRKQAWKLPYPSDTFEVVFCSHMIEHISHFKIEKVICEINRVMKQNSILRILTPDLKKIATAYANNDWEAMQTYIQEDGSGIKTTLGLGHAFMNFIVSAGVDNYLLSSDYSEIVAGYAHVYCYDYEMLSELLHYYGFNNIRQCTIEDSEIKEHKELRSVPYDLDANLSLIIECNKHRSISFSYDKALLHTGPYDVRKLIQKHYSPITILLKCIALFYNTYRFFFFKFSTQLQKAKLFLKLH